MPVTISATSLAGATVKGVSGPCHAPLVQAQGRWLKLAWWRPRITPNSVRIRGLPYIALQSKQNSFVIPRVALRQKDQLYYVLVPDGSQNCQVNIVVGIMDDEQVQESWSVAGQTLILGGK